MNRKQFTILLVLVVVLGAAGLYVYKGQNASRREGNTELGQKLLGKFPINDVALISIQQGTNAVTLVRKDDLWRLRERADYPANYSEISDFLIKAADLKIVQTDQVGRSQLPRLALVTDAAAGSNAATVVDFKDASGKTIKSLLLGKKHFRKSNRPSPMMGMGEMDDQGWPDGRYVKVGADAPTVALISDALANIEPKPEQWLSKDFFKVEKVRSVAVTYPLATNSWKVTRETETGEWKLTDAKPGEQLDSTKTSALSNPLSSPTFNDVDTASKPEQLGLDKPTLVNLETFDNFSYALKVGTRTGDNYPLTVAVSAQIAKERTPGKDEKPEDKTKLDKEFSEKQKRLEEKLASEKAFEKWTYLVSNWTLEPLLKDRSQLMVEKKDEKKEEKPAGNGAASATTPSLLAPPPAAPPAPLAPVPPPVPASATNGTAKSN